MSVADDNLHSPLVEFYVKLNYRLAGASAKSRFQTIHVQAHAGELLRAAIEKALLRDNAFPEGRDSIDWQRTTIAMSTTEQDKAGTKLVKLKSDRVQISQHSHHGKHFEFQNVPFRHESPSHSTDAAATADVLSRRSVSPPRGPSFDEAADNDQELGDDVRRPTPRRSQRSILESDHEMDFDDENFKDEQDEPEEGEDEEEEGKTTGPRRSARDHASSAAAAAMAAAPHYQRGGGGTRGRAGTHIHYQSNSGNLSGSNNTGVAMGSSSVGNIRIGTPAPTLAAAPSAVDKPHLRPLSTDTDVSDPVVDLTDAMAALLDPDTIEEMMCSKINTMIRASEFTQKLQERMKSVVKLHCVPNIVKEGYETQADQDALTTDDLKGIQHFANATAFIISPGLLMTNQHVLPAPMAAAHNDTAVLFDFDADNDKRVSVTGALSVNTPHVGKLLPTRFFWASKELDCAIVAFSYPADEQSSPQKSSEPSNPSLRPPIPLIARAVQSELASDPRLFIIQHPKGQIKTLCMHAARSHLSAKLPGRLLHSSDTDYGSSGSPVLNAKFELVALHRARAPTYVSIDKKGKISLADAKSSHKLIPMNEAVYTSVIWEELFHYIKTLKNQDASPPPGATEEEKEALKVKIDILGRTLLLSTGLPLAKRKVLQGTAS